MDRELLIFDISSDEEPGTNELEPEGDDFDWLSEILKEVDGQKDDSDDVLVVGEVKPRQKLKSTKPAVKDLDDDCVVLDCDPDKPVTVMNDFENGSDDLLIVGEKGQIACRDYPHPRHLCGKYPFGTSPHERHCDMCHCYVCDSLAPCVHWGTGNLSNNHCHATDKEENWKLQRKNFRQGKFSHLLAMEPLNTHISTAAPQISQQIQNPRRNIICLSSNSIPQNHIPMPTSIRACSSTNHGVQSGSSMTKNRIQQHLVPQSDVIRRDNVRNIGNVGTHGVSSRQMFKKVGSVGGNLAANQSGYGSSNSFNRSRALPYVRNLPTPSSVGKNPVPRLNVRPTMNIETATYQSSSRPNMGRVSGGTVPSHPQLYGQTISQSNDAQIPDFNYNCANNTSQNYLQPANENFQVQPAMENLHLQTAIPTDEPLVVKESNTQFPGSTNLGLPDFQMENWALENQSIGISEGYVGPPEMNILYPEHIPLEVGMLYFDFETSWNGL